MEEFPPDFEDQLDRFLRLAGKQAMRNPTPEAFAQWFVAAAPKLLPVLADSVPGGPEEAERFLRVAARSLYGELPLPVHGYVAHALPKQERNAPCACGSGHKYKHCCGRIAMPPLFGNLNLLRYVLDACPKARLADVAAGRASIDAVADTAWQWQEEGDHERAAALLEPWFKRPGPLGEKLAPLFNLLMDAWLPLGRSTKRERLIDDILVRGDKLLRSDALQRRTTMLADRGDHGGAWQAFKQARDLNPNDPALGFLEATTLLSEGRFSEAQGRAQWWAAFLAKQRDPGLTEIIERLRAIAQDPDAGLMALRGDTGDDWLRLGELLRGAPAPTVRHELEVFTEQDEQGVARQVAAELVPDAGLAKLEARWQAVFLQSKPHMTSVQNGAVEVWDNAPEWLDLLQQNPGLWFSFDVLDDLVMALDTLRGPGIQQRMLLPMAERAAEQLRLTLESRGAGPVQCHWGVWPNRPALRPVAHLAFVCLESRNWQRFMEVAHWLVFELNPNDNHGLRSDLSCAYVRFGRWSDVLALARRYPDDVHPSLCLNAALAAFVLGDAGQAGEQLRQASQRYAVAAVKMLLERAPKPVKADGDYGIKVGGKYEAWLYVTEMRPFWEQQQALDWARTVLAKPRVPARKAPPTDQTGLF